MEPRLLYENRLAAVNEALENCFTESCPQQGLLEAMRYSLLSGGKRIRPVLLLSFCEQCGGSAEDAMGAACAVEMLHTYSLIHDDLPAMDNDTLRRGRPTCHVVYGEGNALLAGDALQAAAFHTLLSGGGESALLARAALLLAEAAGERGMCGGQYLDTAGGERGQSEESLRVLHSMKTGALLRAACCMGVVLGRGSEEQYRAAAAYAENVGMAFQIRDDVLDGTSTEEVLGKNVGSDAENGKVTFLTLFGETGCEKLIADYTDAAVQAVEGVFPDAAFLVWLARMLSKREK